MYIYIFKIIYCIYRVLRFFLVIEKIFNKCEIVNDWILLKIMVVFEKIWYYKD